MADEREPIAVIGVGYVGLVTAAGFAELGSDVWCVDIDADRIARLQAGEVPIHEPGLEEVLAAQRERLHFTTDLAEAIEHARLLFVAVGTPPTYSGDADLSAVHAVVDALPEAGNHVLVMKSTVPSGTGAAIKRTLAARGGPEFPYVSCPEFLREGSALPDFRHPDRVVIGNDGGDGGEAGDAVAALYEPLGAPVVRTDVTSAEMIKLASNAFLATKISFINEIANVCEETGADVNEVARGMGLDPRVGASFLQAGIGFGGSCLVGGETVLARHHGRTTLLRLEDLWRRLESFGEVEDDGVIEPHALEVLAWVPGSDEPRFMPVMAVTRRDYDGEVVEVRTKMGRRVTTTVDHPWIVGDGQGGDPECRLAGDLTIDDWVPLAEGRVDAPLVNGLTSLVGAAEVADVAPRQLIVRPRPEAVRELIRRPLDERHRVFADASARTDEIRRTGVLSMDEVGRREVPLNGATLAAAKNGHRVPTSLALDVAFWRIVGLYLAEGHCARRATRPWSATLSWSFHPSREEHLVDEVAAFWLRQGITARVSTTPTSRKVSVSSKLIAAWWTRVLGLGRTSYAQRLPDLMWERCDAEKWALLSGLFEGDGSWSLINGGPSVIIELGTVSDELADGVLRLLGDLGIVASRRIGRGAKSTKDTHWLRVSGAEQVERAIELVPAADRPGVMASVARQAKRIAPTGYRRFGEAGPAWVRVRSTTRTHFIGPVYSLEVVGAHTLVTTTSVICHNCFPKDVNALKQLAGNSGYHFQLLGAVIEVNELQKRRVVAKLQKHLGSLVGKTVTLLGLAFKPNTDDLREASSLVLAARLQAEGAHVRAYDPVAEAGAADLMPGVELAPGPLEAVAAADAVVLVTEWEEFITLDWSAVAEGMNGRLLIDGRNALDPTAVRAAGLDYEGIGRR